MSVGTRTIRFYLITPNLTQQFARQVPFTQLLQKVEALAGQDAYIPINGVNVLGETFTPKTGRRDISSPLLLLNKLTSNPSLGIESGGVVEPLTFNEDENLAEQSSYAFFENNVLAVMRNGQGSPSSTTFREYVNALEIRGWPKIEIIPLTDPNRMRAFSDIRKVTKFQFAVGHETNLNIFGANSNTKKAIEALRNSNGFLDVEITYKISPSSPVENSTKIKNEIGSIISDPAKLSALQKAEIVYRSMETGKSHTYDLLEENIATQVEIDLGPINGLPDKPAVSQAMASAYEGLQNDIAQALGAFGE